MNEWSNGRAACGKDEYLAMQCVSACSSSNVKNSEINHTTR